MSLIYKIFRNFSKSKISVVLVEDFPQLGFEGEIVKVKPGYAQSTLVPKNIAVYNFPGVRQRLFPNVSDVEIANKRKNYQELVQFKGKIEKLQIDIIKQPSFANPLMLKEELHLRDISKEIVNKYQIMVKPEQIKVDKTISKFGAYIINVNEFYHEGLKQKFSFKAKVNVMKPVQKEIKQQELPKESKDATSGAAASTSTSSDAATQAGKGDKAKEVPKSTEKEAGGVAKKSEKGAKGKEKGGSAVAAATTGKKDEKGKAKDARGKEKKKEEKKAKSKK